MPAPPPLVIGGKQVTVALEDMGQRAIVERWGQDGPEADVIFKCNYADRYSVIKGLRGGIQLAGKSFSYLPPAAYPPSPNLFCTAIGEVYGIKPRVDSFGWPYYQVAIIPAHFSVPTWAGTDASSSLVSNGRVSTRFRVSAEIFIPPIGSYFYSGGTFSGKPVAESSVGIVRHRVEISMTRFMIPFQFLDDILFNAGGVNDETVQFGDRVFPRGCLLFGGADTDQVADPSSGQKCWDYTFTFLGNYEVEWNEFMDPSGEWTLIQDGAGDPPFEYFNFSVLFGNTFT